MSKAMIALSIDGKPVTAEEGSTILDAARQNGIVIPTLCYLKNVSRTGSCRMCVVEVRGARNLMTACTTAVRPGMEVFTDTDLVRSSRRETLELLCRDHRMDCDSCPRYTDCEFHYWIGQCGADDSRYGTCRRLPEKDETSPAIAMDSSKCILCRRCVQACHLATGLDILSIFGRGAEERVGALTSLGSTGCIGCGQCVTACPSGALYERDDTQKVWNALEHDRHVTVLLSRFAGACIGEAFHDPIGTNRFGRAVSMLRKMGCAEVLDLDGMLGTYAKACAEEISRRKARVLSSRCPAAAAWIRAAHPEAASLLSDVPSPAVMAARMIRAHEPDSFIVSVTPCTAEKMNADPAADAVITTRELAAMVNRACVSRYTACRVWDSLEDGTPDSWPQEAERAGEDADGSLLDAVRSRSGLPADAFRQLQIAGADPSEFMKDAEQPGCLEIMACPDGCIAGGGQLSVAGTDQILASAADGRAAGLGRAE